MKEKKLEIIEKVKISRKNLKDQNIDGKHMPILLKESLELLDLKPGQIVVDCTVNRAGHSIEFAKKIGKGGMLICIDLDADALKEAKENIDKAFEQDEKLGLDKKSRLEHKPQIYFVCDNFSNLENILSDLKIEKVDVIYADLGISSQELDISGRGFSFMRDEPLLMTFKSNIEQGDLTAKDIVNTWKENSIADIIYSFADEKYSRKIAKSIVDNRKRREIETTFELVKAIKMGVPLFYQNGKTNFATKTFQALRMATNRELDSIIGLIKSLKSTLKESGKACFITFHSTEDRVVKMTTKEEGLHPLNKKIIEASRQEEVSNPRSRSAKLRAYTLQGKVINTRKGEGYIK